MADINHTLTLGPLLRTLTPGLLPHLRWTNIPGGEKSRPLAMAQRRRGGAYRIPLVSSEFFDLFVGQTVNVPLREVTPSFFAFASADLN